MRSNSFDALRILAALAVMASHSWQVVTGNVDDDVVYRASNGQLTLGALAVVAFFGLSGYLVMGSWTRQSDALVFLRSRALRIWPALTVVVLCTVLLIGPTLTTCATYWAEPQTWNYLYNLVLHQPEGSYRTLPGVMVHNPLPQVVNGPLWTLEYEVVCYLALLTLGLAQLLTRQSLTTLVAVLALIVWRVPDAASQPWIALPLAFAVGAALYAWRAIVPWRRDLALLCLLLCATGMLTGTLRLSASTFGLYAVLHLARGTRLSGWGRWGDPSYGIYLWGMLIQQILMTLHLGLSPEINLLFSVPLAAAVAYASWHLIEAPALKLKLRPMPTRSAAISPPP